MVLDVSVSAFLALLARKYEGEGFPVSDTEEQMSSHDT
jgi:hypothetical protein